MVSELYPSTYIQRVEAQKMGLRAVSIVFVFCRPTVNVQIDCHSATACGDSLTYEYTLK